MRMILIFLTCKNKKEADEISSVLLEKKLIACAKTIPVNSKSLWKGRIEKGDEVLLLLETLEERFSQIEKVVRKLHSYETFVMFAIPVVKTSRGISEWLKSQIKQIY